MNQFLFWMLFIFFVLLMLTVDLGFFNRPSGTITFRQSLIWSAAWIAMAIAFAGLLWFWQGRSAGLTFTTGYLLELSLSVDNLFVFLLIFRYFKVPAEYQHKVLFWGILGALVMRGAFILLGVSLVRKFHWVIYLFGAFLIYSGFKLFRNEDASIEPEKNLLLRIFRRFIPVTRDYEGERFFVRNSRLFATPLLIVLLVIETTDVLFATDSVPAVLAITLNTFIVFTSNTFAVLGLRSLYFALAGMMEIFHYLHYGLSMVLIFIGAKMLLSHYYEISTSITLAVIAAVLSVAVSASLMYPETERH